MVKNVVIEVDMLIGIFVINLMILEKNGKHLNLNGTKYIEITSNVLL